MPPSGGTPGSADRDDLSRYVRDYLAEHNESERALARRSRDPQTGLSLVHTWINSLVLGITPAPSLWRLRALAAGMGVPTRLLAELAAAQWLGVEVMEAATSNDEDWVTVTVPKGLTPEEKERFVRMVEEMARHMGK
ncbi:4-oxalocrotonate tautomerase family protein [Nonomuraea sp. NPDC050328]|uniref:4-oxalocrotonate tautomerase family protein n=1 Tax=Nonomuraea sp. NPDC050328 TaxID=3364361 RepID=UPI0037A16342